MRQCIPLLILLAYQHVGAQNQAAAPPVVAIPSNSETGFQSIFNGKDLAGWEVERTDRASWVVEGDVLVSRGQDYRTRSFLMADLDYSDFVLQLEFKLDPGASSGIAIRGVLGERMPHKDGYIYSDDHPLIKLVDARGDEETGSSYWLRTDDSLGMNVKPDRAAEMNPAGSWNTLEIEVKGRSLRASVNSKQVLAMTAADGATFPDDSLPGLNRYVGRIGLQKHTGTVRFRNIRIKSLAASDTPLLVLNVGGHTGNIGSLMFTPDGRELISVSADQTIRFWSLLTGETTRTLRPMMIPEGSAGTGALSPDGKILALARGGADPRQQWIDLIALPEARMLKVIATGHQRGIARLVFSPDGQHLASSSWDGTACLWKVATGGLERVFRGHRLSVNGIDISPDGRLLATSSGDETARIWSIETGETLAICKDTEKKTYTLSSVKFQPDGQGLVTSSWGDLLRVWKLDGTLRRRLPVFTDNYTCFTKDPNRLLVSGTPQGTLCMVVDFETGEQKAVFKRHTGRVVIGAVSPEGKLAATAGDGGDSLYVWNINDGSLVHHLGKKGRPIWSVGWSADGHTVAWGHGSQWFRTKPDPLERTFDLESMSLNDQPRGSFERFRPTWGRLSISRDPTTGIVKLRDGKTEGPNLPGQWIAGYTFLSDGRFVMSNSAGLCVYDSKTSRLVHKWRAAGASDLCQSPDGRYLLASGSDGILRILALDGRTALLSLFVADDDWIAWTPEGYYAASPGGENLMGWQINNGVERLGIFASASQFHKSLYRPDVIKLALKTGSVASALDFLDVAAKIVKDVLPPGVLITDPESNGARLDKPDLTVRAQAVAQSVYAVTAFRLLLNGRPYPGDRGRQEVPNDPAAGKQKTASWQVHLEPGRHRLAVIAETDVSEGQSDEIEVTYEEHRAEPPRLFIVAIGVSKYKSAPQLRYAADDARAVESVFRTKSGPLFKSIEARTKVDGDATNREIFKQLKWLKESMRDQDVGVIFFSGHGALLDGRLFLWSVNAEFDEPDSTAVLAATVQSYLANTRGRLVVMLDACHSGAQAAMLPPRIPIRRVEWSQPMIPIGRPGSPGSLLTKFRLVGVEQEGEKQFRPSTDELVRALSNDEHGVVTISSSTGAEVSMESAELKHGYFTEALTEGLSGKADSNDDGIVNLIELDAYLVNQVKKLSNDRQHPVTSSPRGVRSFDLSRSRP